MNRNIRKITDGAMMAAIIGAILLLNRQTAGILEGIMLYIFPLPTVFYGTKYGWKDSWMLYFSIALLGFLFATPQTLFLLLSEAFIGMAYGCGVHNGTATRTLVFRTVILAVITDIMTMLVFAKFFGYDIAEEITTLETMISDTFAKTGQALPETIEITSFLRNILVVSTIMTGVMEGLVTHFLSRIILKRMRFPTPRQISIAEYYPPKWSGYAGILGFVAYFYSVLKPVENEIVQNLLQGVGMISVFYLAFYGVIAVMVISAARTGKPKGGMVILAVFMLFIAAQFMALGGYLYITTDFHQRLMEGGQNASGIR